MYLILAEKPSAAKNFAKALGGMSGTYNGQQYRITNTVGHIVGFVEPHEMVDDDLIDTFKSWDPSLLPWDLSKMTWQKRYLKSKQGTKWVSKKNVLDKIKADSQGCDTIVIATDIDPSGEGQLLAWEVLDLLKWKGKVKRMHFTDEAAPSIQKSFNNMTDIPSRSTDGDLAKATFRAKWDFASMQLVRLATSISTSAGYGFGPGVSVRNGRLKSVIVKRVGDQLDAIKNYKKVPYFEVKFKDECGNVYARRLDEDTDQRYGSKSEGDRATKAFHPTDVVVGTSVEKSVTPGKLLDIGGLSSILATKGIKSDVVLATYQKMYTDQIVSYPRTDDKYISQEQFKELLPLVDKIASVVGVDTSLLTHRTPRKTHVKDGGAHGANRPGIRVPKSLSSLSDYGPAGPVIYEILAKNFLAMFAEDYRYKSTKASLKDYPTFTTTVNVPIFAGFKAVFDTDSESKDQDDSEKAGTRLGSKANPYLYEGANKKPAVPTMKWIMTFLEKHDIGTGATRTSTIAEITSGKDALLTESRGKLGLTSVGVVSAVMLEGSLIADVSVTKRLFDDMEDVAKFTMTIDDGLRSLTKIVEHDREVFYRNAKGLKTAVGSIKGVVVTKERASGVYAPTGESIVFSREWAKHRFSDSEVSTLLSGGSVNVNGISAKGQPFEVSGSLSQQKTDKGQVYWGFEPKFEPRKEAKDYTIDTAPFPTNWSGYKFTKADEASLRSGNNVKIKAISARTKKPFEVEVSFGIVKDQSGTPRWGISPHFEPRKDVKDYTIDTAPFPSNWSGYTFTKKDENALRAGNKVKIKAISAKTKKPFEVEVSFGIDTYKGVQSWKIIPHFKSR